MVIVVPGLPERGNAEPDVVGTPIAACKGAAAKAMRDRVGAPDHVVHRESAHQSPPQETEPHSLPRPCQHPSQQRRNGETQEQQIEVQYVDPEDRSIPVQITGILVPTWRPCTFRDKQPTYMG